MPGKPRPLVPPAEFVALLNTGRAEEGLPVLSAKDPLAMLLWDIVDSGDPLPTIQALAVNV